MKNMRSALLALGFAGAAYVWRNRQQLQQQFGSRRSSMSPPQLPDSGVEASRDRPEENRDWNTPRERQFGGADI